MNGQHPVRPVRRSAGGTLRAMAGDAAMEQLREAFRGGNLALYLGAGVSVATGLPSWEHWFWRCTSPRSSSEGWGVGDRFPITSSPSPSGISNACTSRSTLRRGACAPSLKSRPRIHSTRSIDEPVSMPRVSSAAAAKCTRRWAPRKARNIRWRSKASCKGSRRSITSNRRKCFWISASRRSGTTIMPNPGVARSNQNGVSVTASYLLTE